MRPVATLTMRQALTDPALLGKVLVGDSWAAWKVLQIAMMGEALTEDERVIFKRLTGRECEPLARVEEFWGIIGRRGGKSRAMGVLIVYLACFVDYRSVVVIGERPLVLCLGKDGKQAAIVHGYVVGIIESTPLLAGLIKARSAESLSLTNGVDIEIRAASYRGLRGITSVAVIADEICFWFAEDTGSANPDTAILTAVRPSLATTDGPLIAIGSPYARRGEAFETWKRDYGSQGDPLILVAHGGTRDLNPSFPQRKIDRALEKDAAAASAEYLAQWRSDLESFVPRELIEAAVDDGVLVRPPKPHVRYIGFTDSASGTGQDSFTAAIAHVEGKEVILDLAHEVKPPFNPDSAIAEIAALLKGYNVRQVTGDAYSAGFVIEGFSRHGIRYSQSDRDRSAIYVDCLPLFTAGRARLIDNRKLVTQFASLERRTGAGRDRIDHPRDAHDDLANSVAGALTLAAPAGRLVLNISDEALRGAEMATMF